MIRNECSNVIMGNYKRWIVNPKSLPSTSPRLLTECGMKHFSKNSLLMALLPSYVVGFPVFSEADAYLWSSSSSFHQVNPAKVQYLHQVSSFSRSSTSDSIVTWTTVKDFVPKTIFQLKLDNTPRMMHTFLSNDL